MFIETITCETAGTWDQDIQSEYMQDYGQEESFGLAQIHLPHHPEITKSEARNPLFALKWMAEEWSKGRESKWSCFNKLNQH